VFLPQLVRNLSISLKLLLRLAPAKALAAVGLDLVGAALGMLLHLATWIFCEITPISSSYVS
jgi:hypothetical protein